MYAHVDLPRLKEGRNGGAFWSAYVPCPKDGRNFADENYADCECPISNMFPQSFDVHVMHLA